MTTADSRPAPPEALDPDRIAAAATHSPWRSGTATGLGSLPGSDPAEAAATVAGELPDLPHLVELPDRGAGADMIGRAAALLVDITAEVVPSGWRLTRRPGRDLRRAKDFLAWDLDAAEQHYVGADWVKIQVAGPWTLAAMIETPSGNRALTDQGAVSDLAVSLTEGLLAHRDDIRRRLPGTSVVIQVDEPALPAVLLGSLPTASGFGTVSPVDPIRARDVLGDLVAALGTTPSVAHCCHPDAPLGLLLQAGFDALSLDLTRLGRGAAALDPIGEAVESGAVLFAGIIPTTEPAVRREPADGQVSDLATKDWAAPVLEIWDRLGLARRRLAGQVIATPCCGLAGATAAWAVRAMRLSRDVASLLQDESQV